MASKASGIFPSDEWMLSQAESKTGPIHVRFRTGLPKLKDRKKFPMLMSVRWRFPVNVATGAPLDGVLEKMDAFEERIIAVSDAERDWASCVVVLTVSGTREWRFFTPDDKTFVEHFNKALVGYGPYPLTIQAFQDPDWNALKEFRAGGSSSAV